MTTHTDFVSIEHFYDANPARRGSPESDYGVMWREHGRTWPQWRVSYVQATGEVYAVHLTGNPIGPVRVLGIVPPDPDRRFCNCEDCRATPRVDDRHTYYRTLDRILDGWADPDVAGHDLAWIVGRLQAAGRAA